MIRSLYSQMTAVLFVQRERLILATSRLAKSEHKNSCRAMRWEPPETIVRPSRMRVGGSEKRMSKRVGGSQANSGLIGRLGLVSETLLMEAEEGQLRVERRKGAKKICLRRGSFPASSKRRRRPTR